MAGTHVALLRGINVGGKNRMPMAELKRLFEDAGCRDVRHYIQSGNIVLNADARLARRLAGQVGDAIVERFGFAAPLQLRSRAQLRAVVANNPFATRDHSARNLFVMFLANQPTDAALATLDPARSPPDEFAVLGSEIYLHLHNSAAVTRLTNAYFDGRLKTITTSRNWQTVNTLLQLLDHS